MWISHREGSRRGSSAGIRPAIGPGAVASRTRVRALVLLLGAALVTACTGGQPIVDPSGAHSGSGLGAAVERADPSDPGERRPFVDTRTGREFPVRGVDYFRIVPAGAGLQDRFLSPAVFDADIVRRDFRALAERGSTTVRSFWTAAPAAPTASRPSAEWG